MDLGVVLARVAVDQRVDGAQLLRKLEDRVGLGAGRRVCTRRQSKVSRSAFSQTTPTLAVTGRRAARF